MSTVWILKRDGEPDFETRTFATEQEALDAAKELGPGYSVARSGVASQSETPVGRSEQEFVPDDTLASGGSWQPVASQSETAKGEPVYRDGSNLPMNIFAAQKKLNEAVSAEAKGMAESAELDTMVRDFCAVGPRPKSEVRRRITEFANSQTSALQERYDKLSADFQAWLKRAEDGEFDGASQEEIAALRDKVAELEHQNEQHKKALIELGDAVIHHSKRAEAAESRVASLEQEVKNREFDLRRAKSLLAETEQEKPK